MEDSRQRAGWLLTVLPAVTFLLGGLVGALFVGLGDVGGESAHERAGPRSATTDAAAPTGAGSTVVIPAACSQAAEAVSQAVDLLREGAGAVRDFRPKTLIEVLDELEVLDPRLQRLASQCAAVDVSPGAPTATGLTIEPPTPTE